jgi:hypothetical protein
MNDYLESHTSANFHGNRQTRVDELENELQNLGYQMDGLERSEVYFEISDYGEDENQIYVDATVKPQWKSILVGQCSFKPKAATLRWINKATQSQACK